MHLECWRLANLCKQSRLLLFFLLSFKAEVASFVSSKCMSKHATSGVPLLCWACRQHNSAGTLSFRHRDALQSCPGVLPLAGDTLRGEEVCAQMGGSGTTGLVAWAGAAFISPKQGEKRCSFCLNPVPEQISAPLWMLSISGKLLVSSGCWSLFPHHLVGRIARTNLVELLIWGGFLFLLPVPEKCNWLSAHTSPSHFESYFIWLCWAIFLKLFLDFYLKSIDNGYLSSFCAIWLF